MKSIAPLTAILLIFVFGSCDSIQSDETVSSETPAKEIISEPHPGENLFMAYCYSCHNNTPDKESRIAPPIFAIQQRYLKEYPTKEKFVEAIIAFTTNPNEENALMREAIQTFGVMPQMSYAKEDLKHLADYIFEGKFTHPLGETQKGNGERLEPRQRGNFVSKATKANLGKNLMAAIKTQGTEGAVSFCNVHALSITDSMRQEMGVESIERVSDQARNPKNKASAEEIEYINTFKQQLEKGEEFSPVLNDLEESLVYYSPIVTNKLCGQCHGTADEIKPEVKARISTLYPEDQAKGYSENQIRGMWKIVMAKN